MDILSAAMETESGELVEITRRPTVAEHAALVGHGEKFDFIPRATGCHGNV